MGAKYRWHSAQDKPKKVCMKTKNPGKNMATGHIRSFFKECLDIKYSWRDNPIHSYDIGISSTINKTSHIYHIRTNSCFMMKYFRLATR